MDQPERMRHYATPEGAVAYERKFRGSLLRRIGHRREAALLNRMLTRFGRIERLLDCPCGAGRMLPTVEHHAQRVVGADLWPTMLHEAQRQGFALVAADAHRLPFLDSHFDVAICHRLIHHIVEPAERIEILTELARVTTRGVVLSFWDAGTRRGRRIKSSRRIGIPAEQLGREARAAGLRIEAPLMHVGPLFSAQAIACLRPCDGRDI